MVKPFVNRIRYTPEVASRPERLEKDLGNAKKLAAILEDEAARLRTAQVQPAGSSTATSATATATSTTGTGTGEEDPQGDANMAPSTVEPPAAPAPAAIEEDEPEPKENGSEAVERRIEKVMSELRDQGLVDVNNEKEYEERKVRFYFLFFRLVSMDAHSCSCSFRVLFCRRSWLWICISRTYVLPSTRAIIALLQLTMSKSFNGSVSSIFASRCPSQQQHQFRKNRSLR